MTKIFPGDFPSISFPTTSIYRPAQGRAAKLNIATYGSHLFAFSPSPFTSFPPEHAADEREHCRRWRRSRPTLIRQNDRRQDYGLKVWHHVKG